MLILRLALERHFLLDCYRLLRPARNTPIEVKKNR